MFLLANEKLLLFYSDMQQQFSNNVVKENVTEKRHYYPVKN
jgi:hypothetical protein